MALVIFSRLMLPAEMLPVIIIIIVVVDWTGSNADMSRGPAQLLQESLFSFLLHLAHAGICNPNRGGRNILMEHVDLEEYLTSLSSVYRNDA